MVRYKDKYPDGININFWKNFVIPNVRRIKGNKCEDCGATKPLHIHHLDYVKEVSINTLRLLCTTCHFKYHKRKSNI